MPRTFCRRSLRFADLRIRKSRFGAVIARLCCIGLLLFSGWFRPPFALADGSMPPENEQERVTAAPSPAARETPSPPAAETPPAKTRRGGSGKARNPYDMETLKRFDAGSHRPS